MGSYYLQSVISPHVSPCGAVVGYVLPETMPDDVSGAVVTLSGNGQSVLLSELQPGVYYDEQELIESAPGQRYDVSARINNNVLLYAHTYIPGEFRMLKEEMSDTLDYIIRGYLEGDETYYFPSLYEPPQIRWTKSKNAFSYIVQMNYNGIASFDTVSFLPMVYSLKGINDPNKMKWTEKYQLTIVAQDSTYLPSYTSSDFDLNNIKPVIEDYISKGMKTGENDNISGGGFGHFSSKYTIQDSVIVRFKKEILSYEEP